MFIFFSSFSNFNQINIINIITVYFNFDIFFLNKKMEITKEFRLFLKSAPSIAKNNFKNIYI